MPIWLALKAAQFIGLPWGKWLRWLFLHPLLLVAVAGWGCWWLADRNGHKWHVAYDHRVDADERADVQNAAKKAAQDANQGDVQAERNRRTADVSKASEQARVGAVDQYAATHRLRTGTGSICATPAAELRPDPGKPDGPTSEPEMVAVSRPDLDGLTQDAVQGAVRLRFLESLVASGQAVVVPDTEKN